ADSLCKRHAVTPDIHGASTACRHTVSGSISPSSSEYFSPFPHGTSALSVREEYLALEDGPPRFPQGFTCPVVLGYSAGARQPFAYRTVTFFGEPFQALRLGCWFVTPCGRAPQPRDGRSHHGLGSSAFARRY